MPTHLSASQIRKLRNSTPVQIVAGRIGVAVLKLFGILAVIIAFYAAIGVMIQYGPAISRWFSPDSRLSYFESRISNIPGEFERRSGAFDASWFAFKSCMAKSNCDPKAILETRDAAIKVDWPEVFDRLTVYDDWGDIPGVATNRDNFFAEVQKKGKDQLRNHCLPQISFAHVRLFDDQYGNTYSFDGFSCDSTPATQ